MKTETMQSADRATGKNDTDVDEVRALNWRSEILRGTVAGAAGLAAFCIALLSGMPKPVSYTIVGLVCLWSASVGADRAIKRRRSTE